jgi:hypothetical protein
LSFSKYDRNVSNYYISSNLCVRGVLDPSLGVAKKVAITGDYNDLKNKPTIPAA